MAGMCIVTYIFMILSSLQSWKNQFYQLLTTDYNEKKISSWVEDKVICLLI